MRALSPSDQGSLEGIPPAGRRQKELAQKGLEGPAPERKKIQGN